MSRGLLIIVALQALIAVCVWVLAGRRPVEAALALLAATAPLEVYRTPVLGLNVSLFRLSLVVALMVLLATHVRREAVSLARNPVVLAYACLLLVMLVSLGLTSTNDSLAVRVISQVGIGVVVVIVAASLVRSIDDPPRVCALLLFGVPVPILLGLWQAVAFSTGSDPTLPFLHSIPAAQGLEVSREVLSFAGETVRIKAAFADPNHFGAYLELMLGPSLALTALALRRRAALGVIAPAAIDVSLVAVLLSTGSRSAWIAGVVCIIAATAGLGVPALRALSRSQRWRGGIAVLVAVAGLGVAAGPSVAHRLDESSQANVFSNQYHRKTLDQAWQDWRSHPVLGVGLADLGPQLGEGSRTSGAHSTFLTVAAELGTVGLLALLAAIALTGRGLATALVSSDRRSRSVALALASGYAGLVVASFFYDLWWDDFQWTVAGAILGLFGSTLRWRLPSRRSRTAVAAGAS